MIERLTPDAMVNIALAHLSLEELVEVYRAMATYTHRYTVEFNRRLPEGHYFDDEEVARAMVETARACRLGGDA